MNLEQVAVFLLILVPILTGLQFYSEYRFRYGNHVGTGSVTVMLVLSMAFGVYVLLW